jgi:hypothetical protein
MNQPTFQFETFYPNLYEIGEREFGSQSFQEGFKEINLKNMKIVHGISFLNKKVYIKIIFNHIPLGTEFSGAVATEIINKISCKEMDKDILEDFIIEKIVNESGSEFICLLKDIFNNIKHNFLYKKKKEFSSWISGKDLESVKIKPPKYDKEAFCGFISVLSGYAGNYEELKDRNVVYQSSVDGNDLYLTYSIYINKDLKIVVDNQETKENKIFEEGSDELHNIAESRMICFKQLIISLFNVIMKSPSEFMNILSTVAYENVEEQFKRELSYFVK